MDDLVVIPRSDLEAMLDNIIERKLKPLREKILHEPDETVLSDGDAALRLHVSVSTLRRMKKNREIGYIATPKGRMVRVCDIVGRETGRLS
jgi:hypothetical protein